MRQISKLAACAKPDVSLMKRIVSEHENFLIHFTLLEIHNYILVKVESSSMI